MNLPDVVRYWHILKKRWWVPVILVVVTLGTMVTASLLAEPVYQAEVRFQVTGAPPGDVNIFQAFGRSSLRDEIFYTKENFTSVLGTLDMAWRVKRTLDLSIDAEDLMNMITIEGVDGSDFTKIMVQSNDPQLSADIANEIMVQGLLKYGEIMSRGASNGRSFIDMQLDQIGKDLEEAQQKLITFKIENRIGDLDSVVSSQQILIRSLNLSRDEALAKGDMQTASNYDDLISERTLELQDQVQLSNQYAALQDKVTQLSQTHNFLLEKQIEAQLKEDAISNLGFIQPLSEARVPTDPEPPIRVSLLALGFALSLVLGVVLVFILEYLENQLNTSKVEMVPPKSEDMLTI
ncbi:MAG: hypothetical protein KDJ65_02740 [Anaerolineae bacterium]|nr:hypothetical protein [Anaerolineae bacterium]